MTVQVFLFLLVTCSTITSLVTEAFKKTFEQRKVSDNLLVLYIALVVGIGAVFAYYGMFNVKLTVMNIVYAVFMGISNWIGAMVGYDKVKQLITQMGGK